jgi:RNA polymerase sigma factor (sigma-70 family)
MRNIPYDGPRIDREQQLRRIRRIVGAELTPLQQQVLLAYYFQKQSITQIAQDRGVNKSTVCRTLHRAEDKLRRYLKY